MKFRVSFTAALLAAGLPLMSLQAAPLQAVPAVQAGNATQATMLAAGWAGAGGCRGRPRCRVVVRRPGQAVAPGTLGPTIHAIDGCVLRGCQARLGGGSLGAILSTADGGESWQVQRLSSEEDRPLFAVHFSMPGRALR